MTNAKRKKVKGWVFRYPKGVYEFYKTEKDATEVRDVYSLRCKVRPATLIIEEDE